MKIKLLFILGGLFAASINAICQPKAILQVIGSTGYQGQSGNIQVASTIGEPIIMTQTAGNVKVTQGFHQDMKILVNVSTNNPNPLPGLSIYPNPMQNELNMISEHVFDSSIQLGIYTINGENVRTKTLPSGPLHEILGVSSWASGIYMIRIQSGNYMTTATVIKK